LSLNQKLELKLKQEQKLTQKLIQKLELIPLTNTEIDTLIENETMTNDFLKAVEEKSKKEEAEDKSDDNDYSIEKEYDIDKDVLYSQNDWEDIKKTKRKKVESKTDFLENIPQDEFSDFKKQLKDELSLKLIDEELKKICIFIIELLDSQGFLQYSLDTVADLLSKKNENREKLMHYVEKAVDIVKNLEPGGFGSLNPAEFLLFQYNKKNIEKPLLKEMLTDYIDDIAKNKILNISSKLGVTPNDIQKNIDYIRKSFKPYPAWGIATENTEYIKIDATITENGNIIMHTKYRQLDVMDKEAFEKYISKFDDKKTVEFLKKQYEKASLLVENYYSRKSLFEQILNVIYERQKSFFEGGHLSALTQTEMSEILGVNVSTVSRAVNGKYIRIPSGIYEVASFFVNISTGDTSQDEAINVIKKIISEENKKKPLSDDDIASILKKEHNIDIKRRTVTKYREKEGIPSSRQRRVY